MARRKRRKAKSPAQIAASKKNLVKARAARSRTTSPQLSNPAANMFTQMIKSDRAARKEKKAKSLDQFNSFRLAGTKKAQKAVAGKKSGHGKNLSDHHKRNTNIMLGRKVY